MHNLRPAPDYQTRPEPAPGSPPEISAASESAERSARLFQQIALQNGFVSPPQLLAWERSRTSSDSSLADYLVSRGELERDDRRLLEELVERAMKRGLSDPDLDRRGPITPTPNQKYSDTVSFHASGRDANSKLTTKIGDYEILSEIARGGMGIVYRAVQKKLNRLVALKVIRAGEFADDRQIARFRVEATAAAKLDHPQIVPVYEVGQDDGLHFFSMALVEGESLQSKVLRDGPLRAAKGATLLQQAARAVHFAHEKGIIHRDLKPHNLLLDQAGAIRVADFGLAKNIGSDSELTATDQIMGTPCYMAPEQAAGKSAEVVAASDVYSLGATLYFVLTGRPPFQAGSPVETIRQLQLATPLPPRKLNPAIPRDLETICLHCLHKDASRRYSTAGELADDLQRWLNHKPIVARPVSNAEKLWLLTRRHPALATAVVAIAVTLACTAGIAWQQRQANLARIAAADLKNDQSRAKTQVDSLLSAPATGVPYALQLVKPLAEHALPILRTHLNDPAASPSKRLRAAIALTQLGEPQIEYLVENIAAAPATESGNLITALETTNRARDLLQSEVKQLESQSTPDWNVKARYAIVLLHLGDSTVASNMCAPRPDLIQRTTFAEILPEWHGDWTALLKIVRESPDASLRASILLGIGQIPPDQLSPEELTAWQTWIAEIHRDDPDPFTHSACKYTARQWQLRLPIPIIANSAAESNRWLVNSVGMTLIRCEPGSFTRRIAEAGPMFQQQVTLTRRFYLAQQETSVGVFREYLAEQYSNPNDLPLEWKGHRPFAKSSNEAPVLSVNWEDSVRFCNWLSVRENLTPTYQHAEGNWIWNLNANGYRLPTAAEWEYACRAGTTTIYYFGNDAKRLSSYTIYKALQPTACGSLPPNGSGFFEMLGNAQEWCYDPYERETAPPAEAVDPRGTDSKLGRVMMGGSFQNSPAALSLHSRQTGFPLSRSEYYGFRVARTAGPDAIPAQ